MRVERWYWLAAFCLLSFCVHLAMTRIGPAYVLPKANEKPQEMEVALLQVQMEYSFHLDLNHY